MSLRIRRGTNAERTAQTFDLGEIVWTTDTQKLYVGDGVTTGGVNIANNLAGTGLQYNTSSGRLDLNPVGITTDNITEGNNKKFFSVGLTQEAVWPMFVNGVHQNIAFTYDNINKRINANVSLDGGLLSVQADTSPKLGGDLTLNGYTIKGTGTINMTGNVTATKFFGPIDGNINATTASMNTLTSATASVTGTATIATATVTTLNATTALLDKIGKNLDLNNFSINGTGAVNFTGDLSATRISLNKDRSLSQLLIETNITNISDMMLLNSFNNNEESANIKLSRARGTYASPNPLQNGDLIFAIQFNGRSADGTNSLASLIGSAVAGNVTNGVVPGNFAVYTTNTDGTFGPRLVVNPDGKLTSFSSALIAGAGSGQVDTGTISSWMKMNFNGVDYAVPMYRIRP